MKTLCSLLILLSLALSHAETDATAPPSLPAVIAPLTKVQLTEKVPNFYYFNFGGDTAEPRLWMRVSDTAWIERYPDGHQSTFQTLGHTRINNVEGTLVVSFSEDPDSETKNGRHQCFIPDKGSAIMHHWVRVIGQDRDWVDLGPMRGVQ